MAHIELKPCVFCGGTDIQVYLAFGFHSARCMDCRCQGPGYSYDTEGCRELAAHAWNVREEHKRLAELEAFAELLNRETLDLVEELLKEVPAKDVIDKQCVNESIELIHKAKVLI